MIKLLIVEDESATRKGLVKHIPWKELGVDVVEEAKDGLEGLEILERFQPDIVLSDIRMPGLNGIEFATKLREQLPNCRIIFLSGYSDKEYLKAAISIGVVNYVEKPINLSEIKEALKTAVALHLEGEKKKINEENASAVLSESIPLLKHKLMLNLIHQNGDAKERQKVISFLKLPFEEKSQFSVAVIKLLKEKDQQKFLDKIEESLLNHKYIVAFKDNNHAIIVLAAGVNDYEKIFLRMFENINDNNLFCAVGQNIFGINQIFESYQTAVLALQKLFFYGYGNIIFYKSSIENSFLFDETIYDTFAKCLSDQDKLQAIAIIEELCREARRHDNIIVNHIKNIFFKLSFKIFLEAEKRGIFFNDTEESEEKYLWDLISGFQTMEEIKIYIITKINTIFKEIEEIEASSRTIFQVKRIIEKGYSDENISTKTLAEQVYLTPTYLSGLFRKETGKTISEYIIEVRIEKSKDYLKDSRLKLFEVAKSVGYSDANYYAKAFKKIVGMTPSEYREKYLL